MGLFISLSFDIRLQLHVTTGVSRTFLVLEVARASLDSI